MNNTNQKIVPEARSSVSLSELKTAAVAIILIEKYSKIKNDFEYSIVFGQRSNKIRYHKGQIAFPGGSLDKEDENLKETAIRETCEEIGINIDLNSSEWEFLGQYPKNFITVSDFLITPFIFVYRLKNGGKLNFKPDGSEIIEVFEVPMEHLLDPANLSMEKREWQGNIIDMYFYRFNGKTIWGITGWLLHDFLSSLTKIA